MSPPGRPRGESFERQREGNPVDAPAGPELGSVARQNHTDPAGARVLFADGRWRDGGATIVRTGVESPARTGDVLPLPSFLALSSGSRNGIGVWLAPADEPGQLAPHVDTLPLIAVDFPNFKDGRGFSTATLLRSRYGFRGDLRAIGDVLVDQLFYLRRVGFSSFALRADQDPAAAVAALRAFSDVYQGSADQPLPYFRRHPAGAHT